MRPKTSSELKQALTLRAAGWTLSAIVSQTGISASTLQRHFKAHSVGRGKLSSEAVELARQQLLNDADFVSGLKHSIASAVIDDLSITRQIREALAISLEEMTEDRTIPTVLKARALAALSTSLKLTQDIQRKALGMDDSSNQQNKELTVLTVRRMTDDDVREAQDKLNDNEEWGDLSEDELELVSQ